MSDNEGGKLDVLAFGAHPDDAELFAGGTLALLARRGYRVGFADLTRGEMSTRGDVPTREKEAAAAAETIGAVQRIVLDLGDGRVRDSDENRLAVVKTLRRYRPSVVMTHYLEDRHPDHLGAHDLLRSACFLSYVGGFEADGERHKVPALVYFFGHERRSQPAPDWVVDVTETFETKLEALRCYKTQFRAPKDESPEKRTFISSPEFWDLIEMTAKRYGLLIESTYAEAFKFQGAAHAGHPFVQMLHSAAATSAPPAG